MMVSAIAAVHNSGILHRDVKVDNFRFRDPGKIELVLLDFGLACSKEKILSSSPCDDAEEGELVGTLVALSPELIGGDVMNPP